MFYLPNLIRLLLPPSLLASTYLNLLLCFPAWHDLLTYLQKRDESQSLEQVKVNKEEWIWTERERSGECKDIDRIKREIESEKELQGKNEM